jgi:sporulation protein YlmC with PRC-barrel domain
MSAARSGEITRGEEYVMKKFVAGMFIAAAAMLAVVGSAVAQSSDPSSAQQGVLIDSGSLIGSAVRDAQGKDLGKVSRLMIDPQDGKVQSVVVSMGGTLGMGGNSVAMPWDQVKIAQDQGRLVVTVDQQMLQQAPKAQSDRQKDAPAASPATGGSGAQQK